MAKVTEEFPHFPAKVICTMGGATAPVCKSLVAVWVGEGLNSALVEQGELEDEEDYCD